ncbi:MAG: SDR family oxidoreductase [Halioglobus sp.]|nr:SDR family oxidoreductase [Halioglobus sp.]
MLLADKVVIVSGIGPGLGVKLAVAAAQEGARAVVLAARTPQKLADAQEQIQALGTSCETLAVATDICERAQCERLVEAAIDKFGRIDALVNSAYYHGNFEPVESADLDEWQRVVNTNLIGTMQLTQAVIPSMKARGQGAIVNINTMATRKPAIMAAGGESGYAASKAALAAATKYLAAELGSSGIRVNSALMGWMWGAPVQGYVEYAAEQQGVSQEEIIAPIARNIPLGRIVTDEECARAALFLVSDYASAVTGASLDVNGGEYMPA